MTNHGGRHPSTTSATMCPVWNGLLTNKEGSSEFVLLDERDRYGYAYKAARCKRA
jgi:hypothetical protein